MSITFIKKYVLLIEQWFDYYYNIKNKNLLLFLVINKLYILRNATSSMKFDNETV